jgi:hypothetical protein
MVDSSRCNSGGRELTSETEVEEATEISLQDMTILLSHNGGVHKKFRTKVWHQVSQYLCKTIAH